MNPLDTGQHRIHRASLKKVAEENHDRVFRADVQALRVAEGAADIRPATELDGKEAMLDVIRLLSIVLPPRERVWWACLAARDYIGPKSENDPKPLTTSEAWVFNPSDENREAARNSIDEAYIDDETVNCALSVLYFDGTLGPADLAQFPAPAGASETYAFVMNVVALDKNSDRFEEYGQMLIDRGVDIARGGNGRMTAKEENKEAT